MSDITITLTAAEAKAVLEARADLSYADADLTAVCHKIKAAQAGNTITAVFAAARKHGVLLGGES